MDDTYHKHTVRIASAPFATTVSSLRAALAENGFTMLPDDRDIRQANDGLRIVAERERPLPALPAVYVWQACIESEPRGKASVGVTFTLRAIQATWIWLAGGSTLVILSMLIDFALGFPNAAVVVPVILTAFLIALVIGKLQHSRLEAAFWQALERKIPLADGKDSWNEAA